MKTIYKAVKFSNLRFPHMLDVVKQANEDNIDRVYIKNL